MENKYIFLTKLEDAGTGAEKETGLERLMTGKMGNESYFQGKGEEISDQILYNWGSN